MFEKIPEPRLDPPEPDHYPCCPICGDEVDTFYKDKFGTVVGCENCVKMVDAWEETDE